jgi:hypothetical protein
MKYNPGTVSQKHSAKMPSTYTKKYLQLLYASTANLLSFSGYNTKKVYDAVKGEHQKTLQ